MSDPEILAEARHLAVMGPKLEHLLTAARSCAQVPGMVAEVGVYRGGSSLLLCRAFPQKVIFGFDTYCGIPEDDDIVEDGHKAGDFAQTSAALVVQTFANLGVTNFHPVIGPFSVTKYHVKGAGYAFVNIDCDIHQTVREAAAFFVPRLAASGGIFFDDYKSAKCAGVKIVADELYETGRFDRVEGRGTVFLKLK